MKMSQRVLSMVLCGMLLVSEVALATYGPFTVEEQDATPSVKKVKKIKVTNGVLTDDGSGTISLAIAGGTGSVTSTMVLDNDLTATDLNAILTFADGDLLDLSGIVQSVNTEGLKLPQAASCASATEEGQICWDSDGDTLYVGDNMTSNAIGGGSTTLQNAYTNDADGSDTTIALSGDDDSIIISNAGANSNSAFMLKLSQNDSMGGMIALHIEQDGASDAVFIDQDADGVSLNIDAESTTANVVDIQADVLTSGKILDLTSNSADTTTRKLVQITNDHASATGAIPLSIKQDSTGNGLLIEQVGNGVALNIDAESTTADAMTLDATALTTGTALDVNATNTAVSNTAIEQVQLDLVNSQGTTANTAGFNGLTVNFTNSPTVSGNTENAMRIQNQVTSNTTDNAVASLLLLDNADTSGTGSTVVTDALRIINTGDISGGITNAINIDDTDVTNDIILQNDEVVQNNTDDLITLTGAGGSNNAGLIIDLDGATNAVPTLSASANDLINVNDNLSVGLDGSTAENIATAGFAFSGNDLYVDDKLGVNGDAYFDGLVYVVDSLNIPSAAAPTVDAEGELAWESDDNDLHIYDGTTDVVLASTTKSRSFVIKSPAAADDFPFWQTTRAITITKVSAICTDATNVVGQLQEYTGGGVTPADVDSDWTITTTELEDTSFSNASIDAGDWVGWKTTSVSGSVSFVAVTFEYYET